MTVGVMTGTLEGEVMQRWEYLELRLAFLKGNRRMWWLSDGRIEEIQLIKVANGDRSYGWDTVSSLSRLLNQLGDEGWQLIYKHEDDHLFMRSK
jgi:hypothetical protein